MVEVRSTSRVVSTDRCNEIKLLQVCSSGIKVVAWGCTVVMRTLASLPQGSFPACLVRMGPRSASPLEVSWLPHRRRWSHKENAEVFTAVAGSGDSTGTRAAGRVRTSVGGGVLDCLKNGCTPQTLLNCVRQHERDTGRRAGVTRIGQDRVKALEQENRERRRANEIPKLALALFWR